MNKKLSILACCALVSVSISSIGCSGGNNPPNNNVPDVEEYTEEMHERVFGIPSSKTWDEVESYDLDKAKGEIIVSIGKYNDDDASYYIVDGISTNMEVDESCNKYEVMYLDKADYNSYPINYDYYQSCFDLMFSEIDFVSEDAVISDYYGDIIFEIVGDKRCYVCGDGYLRKTDIVDGVNVGYRSDKAVNIAFLSAVSALSVRNNGFDGSLEVFESVETFYNDEDEPDYSVELACAWNDRGMTVSGESFAGAWADGDGKKFARKIMINQSTEQSEGNVYATVICGDTKDEYTINSDGDMYLRKGYLQANFSVDGQCLMLIGDIVIEYFDNIDYAALLTLLAD